MLQNENNIFYLGVPFRSGANREGTQHAPKYLIEHIAVSQQKILHFPVEDLPLSDESNYGVKNYESVESMCEKVRVEVAEVMAAGKKNVTIGGDHSISIGSIAGILEYYPNLAVIWFDAHADINTELTSPSGNAHGMSLAALMGLCKSDINNCGNRLKPRNVFWVGVRDVDEGEKNIIQKLGIENQVFTVEDIRQQGMKKIMSKIRFMLAENKIEQLHVSFDIDGMDPVIVPATGTPVSRGLYDVECNEFIQELANNMPPLISLDFVEYNPMLDDVQYKTGKWCVQTLKYLCSLL